MLIWGVVFTVGEIICFIYIHMSPKTYSKPENLIGRRGTVDYLGSLKNLRV